MNSLELKGLRVSKGKNQSDLAEKIEKTTDTYAKKERGEVVFAPDEIAIVATELDMTFEQFNYIFFDGALPFSNISVGSVPYSNIIAKNQRD